MKKKSSVTKSSGNVFLDLGFDQEEAELLQLRAALMSDLRNYVKDNELTQEKAAALFGIAQSRVSDLMRGKWEKFSLEMLISLEFRAGRKVQLKLVA
jgi:predicted XRE-type DNA-binding protein